MDTTSPAPATLAPAGPPATPLARLQALPLRSRIALGAAGALLAAVMVGGTLWGNQPDWRVLYANLGDREGGEVIAALTQMNVPHKFSEGGGAILVPEQQVHELRLRLATQGLPRGGAVGFELMDNQKFGTTQFQERLNFQRGLEGELARSIMALSAVRAARVHLALPQQTAFLRQQQKPSASVLLTLQGGRTLDRGQIAGIVHLVAASVPDLQPRAVSVVDQNGTLLSQDAGDAPNGLDAGQLQYVRQTEQSLAARILSIVEPLVGPGNVKAQVTADVDFTQSESTAELYGPNQGQAPAAVRSQQLTESRGASPATAGGVPGTTSNQPAATPPSPVNGPAQSLSAGSGGGGAGGDSRRDAVTNYEVDKTVKVVRNASGTIRRLSAAVVINHAAVTGKDGKTTLQALAPAQMDQINALVREAIGFDKARGDSVNVVNAPFRVLEAPPEPVLPFWRDPQTLGLARGLAPWIAMPLVALAILLGLVRPALRAARRPLPAPRLLDATVEDSVALPTPLQPAMTAPALAAGAQADPSTPLLPTAQAAAQSERTRRLEGIRQLAKQDPATVANVVRAWAST